MQGTFIWYELMTADPKAAAAFYTDVAGWTAKDSGMEGFDYTLFNVPGFDMGVAGMMALSEEMRSNGVPSHWMGYVAVDDVDAKAQEFADKGGTILFGPQDIPGIGRFAALQDPQGAAISLFKPNMSDGPMPPCPEPRSPGTFGWSELYAGDGASAFDFYADVFGWEKDMAVDMDALGTYQTFRTGDAGQAGGMMTKMPDMPMPFWNYYIVVDAVDAAIQRVTAGGGKLINGPHQVPGGAWIANCLDPQGAMFSLTAQAR